MGRLFAFALCMMLLPASGGEVLREQVLFSMIFPQLVPQALLEESGKPPLDAMLELLFGEGEQA